MRDPKGKGVDNPDSDFSSLFVDVGAATSSNPNPGAPEQVPSGPAVLGTSAEYCAARELRDPHISDDEWAQVPLGERWYVVFKGIRTGVAQG